MLRSGVGSQTCDKAPSPLGHEYANSYVGWRGAIDTGRAARLAKVSRDTVYREIDRGALRRCTSAGCSASPRPTFAAGSEADTNEARSYSKASAWWHLDKRNYTSTRVDHRGSGVAGSWHRGEARPRGSASGWPETARLRAAELPLLQSFRGDAVMRCAPCSPPQSSASRWRSRAGPSPGTP
jgi:hypothetical protein